MSSINKAIVSWFRADADLAAVAGPFNGVIPPTGVTYPYCVFHDRGGRVMLFFDGSLIKPKRFTFEIFSPDEAAAAAYQQALHERFHRAAIPMTGSIFLACVREDDMILPAAVTRGGDTKYVYKAVTLFRIQAEET